MTPSFRVWLIAAAVSGLLALVAVYVPARLLRLLEIPRPKNGWYICMALGMIVAGAVANLVAGPIGAVQAAAFSLLAGAAVAIGFYDSAYLIIPDVFSAALALSAVLIWLSGAGAPSFGGAALCAGLLAAVAWLWRRTKGQEGLGQGDVKLAGALGLMLGVQGGLWMVTAAASSGARWGLVMSRLNPDRSIPLIPFGLFLAVCGTVMIVAGAGS